MSLFFSKDEIVVKICIGESKTLNFDMNLKIHPSTIRECNVERVMYASRLSFCFFFMDEI